MGRLRMNRARLAVAPCTPYCLDKALVGSLSTPTTIAPRSLANTPKSYCPGPRSMSFLPAKSVVQQIRKDPIKMLTRTTRIAHILLPRLCDDLDLLRIAEHGYQSELSCFLLFNRQHEARARLASCYPMLEVILIARPTMVYQ